MQTLIYIGDRALPPPKTYTVSLQDLDSSDSGRSETGVLFRNRVRAGVYKIQSTFRVNRTELKQIADAIKEASFSVHFFDPNTAVMQKRTMYAGDRTSTMVLNSDTAAQTQWDFTVNFIEY